MAGDITTFSSLIKMPSSVVVRLTVCCERICSFEKEETRKSLLEIITNKSSNAANKKFLNCFFGLRRFFVEDMGKPLLFIIIY